MRTINNPRVRIVGTQLASILTMFKEWDFEVVDNDKDAQALVFCGGPDITPLLYGDYQHPKSVLNIDRDVHEINEARKNLRRSYANDRTRPMIGICRGAQLLNVVSGGGLWQDVEGHRNNHSMTILTKDKKDIRVTSTHHQMMRPALSADILAYARISKRKEAGDPRVFQEYPIEANRMDPEVLYYRATNSLCYQPHPEYEMKACADNTKFFFNCLKYLFRFEGASV